MLILLHVWQQRVFVRCHMFSFFHLCALKSGAFDDCQWLLALRQQGPGGSTELLVEEESSAREPVWVQPLPSYTTHSKTSSQTKNKVKPGERTSTIQRKPAHPALAYPAHEHSSRASYAGFPLSPLPPGSAALLSMDAHMWHVPSLWWLWEVDYLFKSSWDFFFVFFLSYLNNGKT